MISPSEILIRMENVGEGASLGQRGTVRLERLKILKETILEAAILARKDERAAIVSFLSDLRYTKQGGREAGWTLHTIKLIEALQT